MNDALTDRCRVFANKHTLGNIARLGVGASKELAADVQAFVEAEVEKLRDANLKFAATLKRVRADSLVIAGEAGRLTRERDAALAEVERLTIELVEERDDARQDRANHADEMGGFADALTTEPLTDETMQDHVRRMIHERDAALAEVERLKVFETAVIVYAISVFEFESAEIGQDGDQRMEMGAAERALLALVPSSENPAAVVLLNAVVASPSIRGSKGPKASKMARQVWSTVGNVGAVTIRDFGVGADVGDYLVQGDDAEAGSDQLYGIGEDYIDECERLLSARGLTLVPDHAGLVVEAIGFDPNVSEGADMNKQGNP